VTTVSSAADPSMPRGPKIVTEEPLGPVRCGSGGGGENENGTPTGVMRAATERSEDGPSQSPKYELVRRATSRTSPGGDSPMLSRSPPSHPRE
jgi:hypothetical protein